MDRAALLGRFFPKVPAEHELYFVDGRANVPAAAGVVSVTGTGTLGGVNHLFRAGAIQDSKPRVHRLIGMGASLLDYQDNLVSSVVFAGAGLTQNIQALLGLPGLAGIPFRALRLSSAAGTHTLQRSTGPLPFQAIPVGGCELPDGVLGVDWEILSTAAGTVHVYLSRLPEDRRFDVIVLPTAVDFTSAGVAFASRSLKQGTFNSICPEAREDGAMELVPIAGNGFEVAGETGGFGVNVRQVVGGSCPTTAVIHVRMLVASYDPET